MVSRRLVRFLSVALALVLLSPSMALGAPTFLLKWGSPGSGNTQFDGPKGIATNGWGSVYIADTKNDRVVRYSTAGVYQSKFGTTGDGAGEMDAPYDVAVDRYGSVYVADLANERIQKWSIHGTYVTSWGGWGSGDGQFHAPASVAVDRDGNVYVTDVSLNRVQKFTSSGTFLAKWGSHGTANGQFESPFGVTTDRFGFVYVADAANGRVQKFKPDGTWVASYAATPAYPTAVAINNWGMPYLTSLTLDLVHRWLTPTASLPSFGGTGNGDGQLFMPWGIDFDGAGLYVVDAGNNRVEKFRDDLPKQVTRFTGANRYAVAVNAWRAHFSARSGSVDHLIIVSGEDRALCDALSAAGLAGVLNAPILLTASARLSGETRAALDELVASNGPQHVVVLGGTGSVSTAAFNSIKAHNPHGTTERISGRDRYVLSANIARRVKAEAQAKGRSISGVLVFNAEKSAAFYDALAAGAISARTWMPMIAVRTTSVPSAASSVLSASFPASYRFLVSSASYLSPSVYSNVHGEARLASSKDRTKTARELAQFARPPGWLLHEEIGLANKLPDSLIGGAFMGMNDGVLLYTEAGAFPSETDGFLTFAKNATMRGFSFGGPASISDGVYTMFRERLNAP